MEGKVKVDPKTVRKLYLKLFRDKNYRPKIRREDVVPDSKGHYVELNNKQFIHVLNARGQRYSLLKTRRELIMRDALEEALLLQKVLRRQAASNRLRSNETKTNQIKNQAKPLPSKVDEPMQATHFPEHAPFGINLAYRLGQLIRAFCNVLF